MEEPNIQVIGVNKFKFIEADGVILNIELTPTTFLQTPEDVFVACRRINTCIEAASNAKLKLKEKNLTQEEIEHQSDIVKLSERFIVLHRKILENLTDTE